MKILYLLSFSILFLTLIFLKKSDQKLNIIVSFIYTFCIMYFYDVLIAYVLSYINIKNTLLMFSTVYIFTSIILIYISYKKSKNIEKQKYYLDKKQLISLITIITVALTIGILKYDKFTEIDYVVTDAALHYKMASKYMTLYLALIITCLDIMFHVAF